MNIHECLEHFDHVRKSGKGWAARCPGPGHKHGDGKLSLSIKESDDGKILLNCHAGCTPDQIVAAKGLTISDLFPNGQQAAAHGHYTDTPNRNTRKRPNSSGNSASNPLIRPQRATEIVAEYDYTDEHGEPLYQNVRFEPKDFRARRKGSDGKWVWNLDGVRRVPYHLPQLLASDKKLVLLPEGEKDVHTAEGLGFTATSSKNWLPEWNEFLRDKAVAIIVDADDSGRKQANDVAVKLAGRESLKMFELPGSKPGGDLTDWVESGGTREALLGFIETQKDLGWRGMFHSYADFEAARPLTFAIKDFLQVDAATLLGGLSEHSKTLITLSIVKALLAGPGEKGAKLWGCFDVLQRTERVLYLIPESSIGPFKHRLKLFDLYDYVRQDRLLVRTLSMGPTPCLTDPRILAAAEGADVVLDTAVRFIQEGEENSATDNQRGLATDIFTLLTARARLVFGLHHAPKVFVKENVMRLENVLRGSGDVGAMVATAFGVKQLDRTENIVHVENIKSRDFEPPKPFQLIGRPFINEEGDFRLHRKPGECGSLMDEQEPDRDRGGASQGVREAKAASLALMRGWLRDAPHLTSRELSDLFKKEGVTLNESTIRHYKKDL